MVICDQWSVMQLAQKDNNLLKAPVMVSIFLAEHFLIKVCVYIVFSDIMQLHI